MFNLVWELGRNRLVLMKYLQRAKFDHIPWILRSFKIKSLMHNTFLYLPLRNFLINHLVFLFGVVVEPQRDNGPCNNALHLEQKELKPKHRDCRGGRNSNELIQYYFDKLIEAIEKWF